VSADAMSATAETIIISMMLLLPGQAVW